MSALSGSDEKNELLSPALENTVADNEKHKSADGTSAGSKSEEDVGDLEFIKDGLLSMDEFMDGQDDEKSVQNEHEPIPGSQGSSESEDLFLVLSEGEDSDNQTDIEKNGNDKSSQELNENDSEKKLKDVESPDAEEKEANELSVEASLSCDLTVNENPNISDCSRDSSEMLRLTAEEEEISRSVSENMLDDEDDSHVEQVSKETENKESSKDSSEGNDAKEELEKNLAVDNAGAVSEKNTSACLNLQGEQNKDSENSGDSDNPDSLSFPGVESETTTESVSVRSDAPSDKEEGNASNKEHVSAEDTPTQDVTANGSKETAKPITMDISSTLPCGLFKDDSLEEFSLSPKDGLSLSTDPENASNEANGLSENEPGMSIEDIIDNLSSPIGEDANEIVNEKEPDKDEIVNEQQMSISCGEKKSNKRLSDFDGSSNDRVEVKKVKLDPVFNEKLTDGEPENSDQARNSSPSVSVEEVVPVAESVADTNISGNGTEKDVCDTKMDVCDTKMDVCDTKIDACDTEMDACDDDIDIIEEKCSEAKPAALNENTVEPDVKEKKVLIKEDKPEIKVNGIGPNHCEEVLKNEVLHVTEEQLDELVLKRLCDKIYDDHFGIIVALTKKIESLEKSLEKSKRRVAVYQNMLGNLSNEHRKQLSKLGYGPKVHTRTVGVNVRILQEHEIQSTNRLRVVKDALVPSVSSAQMSSVAVSQNTNMQLAQATAKKCILPRAATTSIFSSGPRMPAPNVTVSQITVNTGLGNDDKIRAPSSMQIIPSVNQGLPNSPSVMNRPRMQPSILRRQPVPKSPGNVTSSASIVLLPNTAPISSSSSINVIDLTEDGDSSLNASANSQSSGMAVSQSVTRGPSNNLVQMPIVGPLSSVVQILPPNPHMTTAISGGNAIRVNRPPSVLPNSTCLPQTSRVAYLLPPNPGTLVMTRMDGQVSQIRNIQPHQSQFVTSSGQHVPTILMQMNALPSNPTPVASTNTVSAVKSEMSQGSAPVSGNASSTVLISRVAKHPAPLPSALAYPENKSLKALPPKPALKISKVSNGIVLSWNMSLFNSHADIATYQLFAYQESNQTVSSNLWRKVGDVKALPLPMACTLTQFVEGHKYHFAVRAVDVHNRIGPFSDPSSIVLLPRSGQIPSK